MKSNFTRAKPHYHILTIYPVGYLLKQLFINLQALFGYTYSQYTPLGPKVKWCMSIRREETESLKQKYYKIINILCFAYINFKQNMDKRPDLEELSVVHTKLWKTDPRPTNNVQLNNCPTRDV